MSISPRSTRASRSIPALPAFVRDVASGALMCTRLALAVAGFALLSAALALLASQRVRDRAVELAADVVGIERGPAGEAAAGGATDVVQTGWVAWLEASAPGHDLQHARVAQYLSRRYRVAEGALRPIVAAAYENGRSLGVDPLLILAVTAIESGMNPFAQSSVGAQGLMQVMTSAHRERFTSHGGDLAALDPLVNVKVGSAILKELIRRGGSVERGLQLYVGAGNLPDDGGYADRVLGELARIRSAAGGNVGAALAAAWRGDSQRARKAAPEQSPAAEPAASPVVDSPAAVPAET